MMSCHLPRTTKTRSPILRQNLLTNKFSNNPYFHNITNNYRKENLFEHGMEDWRTRRKQRRRNKGRGGNGAQNTFISPLIKSSTTEKLWILLSCFLVVFIVSTTANQLDVRPKTRRVSGTVESNISLTCLSSVKPVLCLWKTPYGHVYTLSEGVFAESGRIRHKKLPQGSTNKNQCGIEILGVEDRDSGQWECEVGAVVGEDFKTSTANINLDVKAAPAQRQHQQEQQFEPGEITSRQEVGNDVILHCSANREVHLCRWKTPYLNTYIVGEGIYVERGRIQWLGSDPNYDCTIRVANLDLRDSGTWVCEIGSSTKESFQVQTKEFVIDIETPLKLSAPTSLMQNANTDATLVCHANKPFDDCLWTTPYGKTYSFKPNDPSISHENGRLAYFGFADTDCGVIVHNVQSRDNGGWLCQLHSHNGGNIFQNATDIVPLFADSAATRLGAAQPRSIPDYDDYDKTISLDGNERNNNKDVDYDGRDFSGRVGTPAIDTYDYDNIDFDKVNKDIRKTTVSSFSTGFTPTEKPKIVGQIRIDRVRPGSDQGAFTKIVGNPTPTTSKQPRFRTSNGVISASTESGISESTLQDIINTSGGLPMLELSKISPTSSSGEQRTNSNFGKTEETTIAHPLSVLTRKPATSLDKKLRLSGVDPLELELLSRISGTHRDTRPARIGSGEETEEDVLKNVRFESSKTTPANFDKFGGSRDKPEEPRRRMKVTNVNSGFTFPTEKNQFRSTTPSSESHEEMRLREIQRIRDERRRKAMVRQKQGQQNHRRLEQKNNHEKSSKEQENIFVRESEIARQKEKKRKEELARRAEVARRKEAKRQEELARKAENERQAEIHRQSEVERLAEIARQEHLARRKQKERQDELARKEEKRRQEEIARKESIARKKEKERREEQSRKEEKRKQEEIARHKEIMRQKELAKQAEIARQKEIERIEDLKRQEEIKLKKEKEIQDELAREAKIEEERKRKEEQELAALAELLRQEELAQKRRAEAAARREAKKKEEQRLRDLRAQQEKERKIKAEEDRLQRLEEDERKRKFEEERLKHIEEDERRRVAEEERLKRLEEEDRKRKIEAERRRKAEEHRIKRLEEEERKRKLEAERKRRAEEERLKRIEEEERKRKFEAERKKKQEERKRLEEKRRKEAVRKREEEEKSKREEKEKKDREEKERLEEQRKTKLREEEERKKLEAERKQKEEEFKSRLERERRRKEEAARRRAESERRRKEVREKRRKDAEKRKKEEEERLKQEVEKKRKEEEEKAKKDAEKRRKEEQDRKAEEERIRKEMQERRRKEKEQNGRIAAAKKEDERRKRIQSRREREEKERRRKEEAEKQRKIEEERQRKLDVEKAKVKERKEKEESQLRRREEERKGALGRIREERLKVLQKNQEEETQRKQEQERFDIESKRNSFGAERERRIQEDIRRKAELEKQQRREELERRRQEKEPQTELNRASLIPRTESPRSLLQSSINLPITDVGDTKCYITPTPTNGNITCNGDLIDDEYIVSSGRSCILKCRQGFVSLRSREARCMTSGRLQGRWSQRLECVRPDAMIIIGGRNSNGVLSSVELVTGRGVCRGAVPPLPAMRWKMIATTVDEDRVLACGGTNIFGDPKSNCWILGFRGRTPFWSPGPDMLVARDAAAWSVEGDYLFVMGGSLGKLKGSTKDVEMYQVSTGQWVEGPPMSSARHAHCAVGLGNGSLIVTGGYGGLEVAERFDLATGLWKPLPELSPVRAQHGCALVELHGEQGIMVVGGDSGGTRLRDVRFLPLDGPNQEWRKVADLRTARWGRPGVAIVGGRIAVAGGWDGSIDLDTVEYYDETERKWQKSASRLQTKRRWGSSSPISIRLFPKCAQKRE